MCSRSIAALILFLSLALSVSAEEHGAAEANYSGKQDQSWELIQAKLAALKTKMDSQTILVNNLVAEKAALNNSQEVAKKAEELKTQHHKLEELVADYNKLNDEYLTKFPERGLKEKRVYQRVKLKTLDSFEDDFTLRGKLNKLHSKVLRQYPGSGIRNSKASVKPAAPFRPDTSSVPQDVTGAIELKK